MSVSVFLPYLSGMQSPRTETYGRLWPACLYRILPRFTTNGTIPSKKLSNTKYVFWNFMFVPCINDD